MTKTITREDIARFAYKKIILRILTNSKIVVD